MSIWGPIVLRVMVNSLLWAALVAFGRSSYVAFVPDCECFAKGSAWSPGNREGRKSLCLGPPAQRVTREVALP